MLTRVAVVVFFVTTERNELHAVRSVLSGLALLPFLYLAIFAKPLLISVGHGAGTCIWSRKNSCPAK